MRTEEQNVREIEIDVRKYLSVLARRWWIILFTLFITADVALLAAFLQTDEYLSEAKLLFESGRQASSLIGLEDTPQDLRALTNRDDPLDTQIEILRSIPLAERVIGKLGLVNEAGKPLRPQALLGKLEVKSVPGTDVIKIGYLSEVPELSVEVVDTVMSEFIEQNVKSNRSAAVSAQRFIENQLPGTDAKVDQAEEALKQFKEIYDIVDLGTESERIVSTITSIDNNLTQLRSQYANLKSRSNNLQSRLQLDPDQAYRSSAVSQSPAVAEVLGRLNAAESELASEQSQYDESHPIIIDLKERVASLRALLNQRIDDSLNNESLAVLPSSGNSQSIKQDLIEQSLNIDNELAGLSKQIDELVSAKAQYELRAKSLPSLEKQYQNLQREFNAARTTHERLLENLQEVKVLQNQSIGNARVISPAQLPSKPIGLPKSVFFLGGGLLGLVLGTVLAFLVDLADEIKGTSNIHQLYEYPILGIVGNIHLILGLHDDEISRYPVDYPSVYQSGNKSVYAELVASLKSRRQGHLPKVMGLTSTVRHEGTSAITADFALALAQLGKSVLIIDANLSQPIQHHLFNISNQVGLSDVIASNASVTDAIQTVGSCLHILPAGSQIRKASSLLKSKISLDIIQQCQDSYDFILVDMPSLNEKFGALDISFVKDLLIVSYASLLRKSSISKAKKRLLKHPANKVLGIIINKFSSEVDPQSLPSIREEEFGVASEELKQLEIVSSNPTRFG